MQAKQSEAVLYLQGTFSIADPTKEQIEQMVDAANQINKLGFTTIILGQWHVHADGSMYYNDSPLDSVINQLQVIVTAIKMGGGSVQKVLITFGPFGSDFDHIASNLGRFKRTVTGLRALTGIDGLDWDLEQEYSSTQADLLVELTRWATGEGMIVTAAPYEYQDTFWNPVLTRTNKEGSTGFSWWNLQLYGGADYPSWEQGLGTRVPNPQSFLVPGWNAKYSAPSDVQSQIAALKSGYSGLSGAFIWKYESTSEDGHTPEEYYAAIIAGLEGSAQSQSAA